RCLPNSGDPMLLALHLDDEAEFGKWNRERANISHTVRLTWNLQNHPNTSDACDRHEPELDHFYLLIADASTIERLQFGARLRLRRQSRRLRKEEQANAISIWRKPRAMPVCLAVVAVTIGVEANRVEGGARLSLKDAVENAHVRE